ncbi:hypothetical protein CEXT_806471 [Caerostris extrusa]|uniref:Uncharacterized protein n=1 Tax=Caerostris extrusa TaxID=172846 RepID=A0AAV4UCH2_CAEEX|nr:hypothetical protein CEXT_806471 [Caerostris extrusa]
MRRQIPPIASQQKRLQQPRGCQCLMRNVARVRECTGEGEKSLPPSEALPFSAVSSKPSESFYFIDRPDLSSSDDYTGAGRSSKLYQRSGAEMFSPLNSRAIVSRRHCSWTGRTLGYNNSAINKTQLAFASQARLS